MADHASRLSRIAAGQALSLDGPVVISAGEVIAASILPPIARKIRELHPGITVEILATNQTSDLGRREADIALRSYRPTDDSLIAKKVRTDTGHLYATPTYLASIGDPTTRADLSRADFVAFDTTDAFLRALNAMGLELTADSFPYVCANQNVQWALITQGAGVGVMISAIGDADPRVRRALDDLVFDLPMWLTSHREVRTSRRVRVVFDLLAEALAGDPWSALDGPPLG